MYYVFVQIPLLQNIHGARVCKFYNDSPRQDLRHVLTFLPSPDSVILISHLTRIEVTHRVPGVRTSHLASMFYMSLETILLFGFKL